jgi:hypothetical protein
VRLAASPDASGRLRIRCIYLLSSFIIVAYPGNDNLTVRIFGSDHILTTEKASKLLETVCAKIESFSTKI